MFGLAWAFVFCAWTGGARAADRMFMVILANSPKQYPNGGQPPGGFVNPTTIDKQYFDATPFNGINSFAEYWEEISYGDVTIAGRTVGWIDLPWAIQPPLLSPARHAAGGRPPVDDDINNGNLRVTPFDFYDMNRSGGYEYGAGEFFNNSLAASIIDLNGDPFGMNDGPFSVGPGSGDESQRGRNAGLAVWMPGERFVDMDDDGKWDGLDQALNWGDWFTAVPGTNFLIPGSPPDGRPDLAGPWIDLNGDNDAQNSGNCSCTGNSGCYLVDSDNDFFPDCCPNGPGTCPHFSCPPTRWEEPGGVEVIDCNGNLVSDFVDIGLAGGTVVDFNPWRQEQDDQGRQRCVAGAPDGIPDQCQYVLPVSTDPQRLRCTTGGSPQNNVCLELGLPPCVERDPPITPRARCEYADSVALGGNGDGQFDVVEPFENFIRRWDPCIFDPDASPENLLRDQTHWIKVYDPISFFAGVNIPCNDPQSTVNYADPSYIINNYPGDPRKVIAQANVRPIFGQHDPLNRLAPNAPCTCAIGIGFTVLTGDADCCDEDNYLARLFNGLFGRECHESFDVDGDGSIEDEEQNVCVQILPVEGGPCRDLDINEIPGIQNNERKLCIAGFHAQFDPSDNWINQTVPGPGNVTISTTKLQIVGSPTGGAVPTDVYTPEPGTYGPLTGLGEEAWYEQAWTDRYGESCFSASGGQTACTPPPWPERLQPGNSPIVAPFVDTDEDTYAPEVNRRFFQANWGGLNGFGTGWTGGPDELFLRFETGPLGESGFEESNNHAILPEEPDGQDTAGVFYDGWVEYDDLPSSKYHSGGDQWLGEITGPYRTYLHLRGVVATYVEGLLRHEPPYQASTEEDAPRVIPAIWGDDRGNHNPDSPQVARDGVIIAAGPYAKMVHGSSGRDGGNVMLMELLTRRTDGRHLNNGKVWEFWHGFHPYAGATNGENLGFRDYNLDGLIDQGEVRPAGSDNYIADADRNPVNDGTNTLYPWNRRRLLEDCIAVVDDDGPDLDDFADAVSMNAVTCDQGPLGRLAPPQFLSDQFYNTGLPRPEDIVIASGVGSGIVLLPAGGSKPDDFPTAPFFYPIHNEDGLNNTENPSSRLPRIPGREQINWNIFFHDLVATLDSTGESGVSGVSSTFLTDYSAHEYLHTWEHYPDLYDYDVFQQAGAQVNCPVGIWDIMANGGLVHPTPILKELPCTAWIEPVDLTTVVTPGVDKTLTLPPAEFVRDNSYFFLENENRLGERFYFWSAGSGFDSQFPGAGMLILHTDVGSNPDALPRQQRVAPFSYYIIQADGEDDMNSCINAGDAGDPWPGATLRTLFDCNTVPAARWYSGDACSGLSISNITPDAIGSMRITVNWVPTSIPGLRLVDPPGGSSVGLPPEVVYQVRGVATDVYGGTWLRFFYTNDETDVSIDPNGANFIGTIKKNGPGSINVSAPWNINNVPDGRYFVFAELIPARGADGTEKRFTDPKAGRNNTGNGTMTVHQVNTNEIVGSGAFGILASTTTFSALNSVSGQPIDLRTLGVQVGDQLTLDGFTPRGPILRTISAIENGGRVLRFSPAAAGTHGFGPWQIARAGRTARSETWTIEAVNAAGTEWKVFSSLTQPEPPRTAPNQDPYPHAVNGTRYTSLNGAVVFTIHAGTRPFIMGDMFTFTTTGKTAPSHGVAIANRVISEAPTAIIVAAPLAGDPPLRVSFDGRNSVEPNGEPLLYRWDFGDGSGFAAGSVQTHTFSQPRTFSVVLRVTNARNGLFHQSSVDIAVTNNSPNAVATADPTSGRAPLEVRFDGGSSSDAETNAADLIYQWDFGDGTTVNDSRVPGASFARVSHLYSRDTAGPCTAPRPCSFTATLTVTDDGGKQDSDHVTVVVGNSRPLINITTSSPEGPDPLTVIFNAINSTDPDGDKVCVLWHWDDGTADTCLPLTGPSGSADGAVTHEYRLPAGQTSRTFRPTAIIRDYPGDTSAGCTCAEGTAASSVTWPGVTITVSVPTPGSSDPQAIFTITPNPPVLGEPFTVDARRSYDRPPSGRIASYSWVWGDGTPAGSGATATHTFTRAGTFTIALTVSDADTPPHTNTKTTSVTVAGTGGDTPPPGTQNRAPVASFTMAPPRGAVGGVVTFDGRASTDPDGDALQFSWSFGDGSTANGSMVEHTYSQPGTYLVRLTVTDIHLGSTDAAQSIVVESETGNRPPVVHVATGPRSGPAPLSLTFDARNSYDPDGDVLTFRWEFRRDGEMVGEPESGPVVTRMFTQVGTYTVELVVSDTQGSTTGTEPELITVFTASQPPRDPDRDETPAEQEVPTDSACQRPQGICAIASTECLIGTLLGLSLMFVSRRRMVR